MPLPAIRRARLLAWGATIASAALAIGPNFRGQYDAPLAVLTATLIALVWYTYFTYESLHTLPPIALRFGLSCRSSAHGALIVPKVSNPNSVGLDMWLRVEIWADDHPLQVDAVYSGAESLFLAPREVLRPEILFFWSDLPQSEPQSMKFRISAKWRTHRGEEGDVPAYMWFAPIQLWRPNPGPYFTPYRVIGASRVANRFGSLKTLQ